VVQWRDGIGVVEVPPEQLEPLARILHSEETSGQRKIRPPSGRGDSIAASPDNSDFVASAVGPTGTTPTSSGHTRGCEIFGLGRRIPEVKGEPLPPEAERELLKGLKV